MSTILGRIARSGSTVTIRRSSKSRTAGGSTNQTWTSVLTDVRVLFDAPSAELAQKLFGQETKVMFRAFCSQDFDIQRGDGMIVSSGWLAGEYFQVDNVVGFDQARFNRHKELGLVKTKETFA